MDHDRRELGEGTCARLRSTRRKPRNCPHKRGLNTKIHLAVDARGVPVRCFVTDGVTADCAKAGELVENVGARGLIADRAYDSNKIIKTAESLDMKVVIPPRKNRKIQRKYDKKVYKIRRLVENAFLHLKRWRGVATRYCKNLSSFLAAVQIRCLAVLGKYLVTTESKSIPSKCNLCKHVLALRERDREVGY
ncbi:MAG: IS5 family transposase [Alphaproteobacteria bacterium]|nr:IS5 family transposase [Alphaproteobacteria bacterium]